MELCAPCRAVPLPTRDKGRAPRVGKSEMSEQSYVVATVKPWNVAAFHRRNSQLPGRWWLIERKHDLQVNSIQEIRPRYIFFPHWSWRVPEEILAASECVCFHMTDLPYGRGGSPLQNLIERGHTTTMLSALRMVSDVDAGPIYFQRPLSLDGRAQEIYEQAAELVFDMVAELVESEPEPEPQRGDITHFQRRSPEQSAIPTEGSIETLFDHIRMLDADTYPRAFLNHGRLQLEFSHASLSVESVTAQVTFRRKGEDG